MRKKRTSFVLVLAVFVSIFVFSINTYAQQSRSSINIGQFYARGGYARLDSDRSDDLLTGGIPVFNETGIDDKDGWNIATGIGVMITPKDPFFGQELLGEVGLEFSRYGDGDRARNLPSTVETALGLPRRSTTRDSSDTSEIAITQFNVHMGPKLRFSFGEPTAALDWKRLHPYIGAAMMYGVISPPSDDVTYLDIGALVWAGFDYEIPALGGLFSIGADYRYHFYSNQTGEDIDYASMGVFIGVNW